MLVKQHQTHEYITRHGVIGGFILCIVLKKLFFLYFTSQCNIFQDLEVCTRY